MKWIRRAAALLALAACLLAAALFFSALDGPAPAGFETVVVQGAEGRPMAVGVWYPAAARTWPVMAGPVLMKVASGAPLVGSGLPLVLISHGNGGGITGHADLALALAGAGYVVAAPMHPGDNFADQGGAGSSGLLSKRAQDVRRTIDYMLGKWQGGGRIDAGRIGAFGFSMGGTTVLALAGAQPDFSQLAARCAGSDQFVCAMLRHHQSPLLAPGAAPAPLAQPDARIKAAVAAAPGFGFIMGQEQLAGVQVPVQLWSGGKDGRVDPAPIAAGLGVRAESHPAPGAGHLSFLAPCSFLAPPSDICSDPQGFDRAAFHAQMNARVLGFFERHLKR